jgi:N-acetylmuramic acid 6-phosphate etherase
MHFGIKSETNIFLNLITLIMPNLKKTTEADSLYNDIEKMSTSELLNNINTEDQKVAIAIKKSIESIEKLVDAISIKLINGGRLFYIGAGTSGRLAVVDASECPPSYGVPDDLVIAIIAGGQHAMFQAVENAEDNLLQAWLDLKNYQITEQDIVVGIAASGTTPYVLGGLQKCQENNIITGSISCNYNSLISSAANYPIEVDLGPEFITGSTRMKSGTAQKLILNMISTSVMVKLGRIEGNKMVNMQLTNNKLINRGIQMIIDQTNIKDHATAESLLKQYGSVKKAVESFNANQ